MKNLGRNLLYFCALAALLVTPLAAQTVDLSTRTFWIGERPDTMDGAPPFIALRRIGWIETILSTDPVLSDAVVHIEQTYVSVADAVAGPNRRDVLLDSSQLPSQFFIPYYQIYGSPVAASRSITYVPTDSNAGFVVHCNRRDDIDEMLLCVVYARYAPDDFIRLKARLYFPSDPADAPDHFLNVVNRMREVAHCLDVTGENIESQTDHPDLSGCKIETIS